MVLALGSQVLTGDNAGGYFDLRRSVCCDSVLCRLGYSCRTRLRNHNNVGFADNPLDHGNLVFDGGGSPGNFVRRNAGSTKFAGAKNVRSDRKGLIAEGEKNEKGRFESNHFDVDLGVSIDRAKKWTLKTYNHFDRRSKTHLKLISSEKPQNKQAEIQFIDCWALFSNLAEVYDRGYCDG